MTGTTQRSHSLTAFPYSQPLTQGPGHAEPFDRRNAIALRIVDAVGRCFFTYRGGIKNLPDINLIHKRTTATRFLKTATAPADSDHDGLA